MTSDYPRFNTVVTHTTLVEERDALQKSGDRRYASIRRFEHDQWELSMADFENGYYVLDRGMMDVLAHYSSVQRARGYVDCFLGQHERSEGRIATEVTNDG